MTKNIVIIGGVAAGMACATRLRRLNETIKITVVEKGPNVSFANCGLPYHIGNVIKDRSRLIVKTPEEISKLFNIEVKTRTEATQIDRENKTVSILNIHSGLEETLSYDKLVITTGAEPFIPPIPGINDDRVFKLRNLEDMDKVKDYLNNQKPERALVIGGGFIGLEMAENLKLQGLKVNLVELAEQVMMAYDKEMATLIHQNLLLNGIHLYLNNSIKKLEPSKNKLLAHLKDGTTIDTDLVVMAIGVKPDTNLAVNAGLELGLKESIVVNEYMQTSDPDIYAAGDAVQVKNYLTGKETLIPLAGPANRQGRTIAANISGKNKKYLSTLGTSICKIFEQTVANTGLNEKTLIKEHIPYLKTYIHSASHAGYYPDSYPLTFKLLFAPETGKVLGAQVIGYDGVDKRIDILSTSIMKGLTVYELEDLELSYAPPYNSVKDPVNVLGNVAVNMLEGLIDSIYPEELEVLINQNIILLNVSTEDEHQTSHIPGSINIPVENLRDNISRLDKSKTIVTYCQMGLRGYIAHRILKEHQFKTKNLNGGLKIYKAYKEIDMSENYELENMSTIDESFCSSPSKEKATSKIDIKLDACGLQCPGPIMQLKTTIDKMNDSEIVQITASDPGFLADVKAWCNRTGNDLQNLAQNNGKITATIAKKSRVEEFLEPGNGKNLQKLDKTIVLFSNDLDKALAAFIIANGAASMGDHVNIFFTFWGLNVLRKSQHTPVKKGVLDKMFGFMMPRGPKKLALSKMHMLGMGTEMMKFVMKNKNVLSLPDLMLLAQKNGVRLVACTMSMDVMGIKKEELIDGVEEAGVAGYLDNANNSAVNLFI
jgi:NADPH-dependent 2,4-dienoyl-CoA reductase/sulfur reductase-like enzyme/peroxiredoxin family protein/TusA-related sulfurtransferase/rhodanese-related sulfurtransferase